MSRIEENAPEGTEALGTDDRLHAEAPVVHPPFDILASLPALAGEVADANGWTRGAEILRRYYGLSGSREYTLEEIGSYFGITRERVRQLRNRVRDRVAECLSGQDLKGSETISARAVSEFDAVRDLWTEGPPFQTVGRLRETLSGRYSRDVSVAERPLIPLLAELLGGKSFSTEKLGLREGEEHWSFSPNPTATQTKGINKRTRALLEKKLEGVTWFELTVDINQRGNRHVPEHAIRDAVALMLEVESVGDEFARLRFECLSSHGDRAYRVLVEEGDPPHFTEIAKRVNRRCREAGVNPVVSDPRTVASALSLDARFEPIGNSGKWKLSEWEEIRGDSVRDLMVEALRGHLEPLSYDEVFEYVIRHRADVPRATIAAVAHAYPEHLVRVGAGRLALPEWGIEPDSSATRRSTEEIFMGMAAVLIDLFDDDAVESLPLADVIRACVVQENMNDGTVRGRITRAEWADVHKENGRLKVRVNTTKLLESEPRQKSERPVFNQVRGLIRELLSDAPERTLPVRSVRDQVRRRAFIRHHTFYWVLSLMEGVEKYKHGGVLHVRLSDELSGPQT